MPASPFVSSRISKDGPKKTIDRSQKEGEQGIKKTANDGFGQASRSKPEGERCRAHHNAKIADIRARDTTRPRDRWMERFEPIFFSQTGVRGFGILRAAQPVVCPLGTVGPPSTASAVTGRVRWTPELAAQPMAARVLPPVMGTSRPHGTQCGDGFQ